RVADRAREFAALDEVALRRREYEVTARNVHLPSAEIRAIQTSWNGADDLLRIAFSGHHESVRHAGHRNVFVAFAASASSGRRAENAARQIVLHIAAKNSVF